MLQLHPPHLLLRIHFSPLQPPRMRIHMCLPRWSSQKPNTPGRRIVEDGVHLLERFLGGLWENEEDMEEHGNAENTEEYVDLPADVGKGGRNEVGECKVER
jgi:hypothetical protein